MLGGKEVARSNATTDITTTEIRFEKLDGVIIPESTTELELALQTATIGENETGIAVSGLKVTGVDLSNMQGADSGKDVPETNSSTTTTLAKEFSIVPAVVTASVVSSFGADDKTSEIRLNVSKGDNTTANGDAVQAELKKLYIEVSSLTST